jgi:predicted ATPase
MRVTFNNTGMIKEADILLNGLTVIAGENDTGKSTIGKLLFSIIKTFNRYEKDARVFRVNRLEEMIDEYYAEFKKKYSGHPWLADVKSIFTALKNDILQAMENPPGKDEILSLISEKLHGAIELVKTVSGFEISFEYFPDQVAEFIDKKTPREEIFRRTFLKYMNSVFNGEITKKFFEAKEYSIKGEEDNRSVFEISGSNGSVSIRLNQDIYYEDATFIESPILINLANLILSSKNEFDMDVEIRKRVEYLDKGYAPEYMKDIIKKLTDRDTRGQSSEISENIRDIIRGDFYYDPEERDFVFEKGNKTFKGVSIASGIKQLGTISILLLNGFISRKSLLVIDEPETHMHPAWIIRFAEVVVKMARDGNHILLTSHSPYFIEALQLHADKLLDKNAVAFYLCEEDNDTYVSRVYNVTHNLSPIYRKLARPFDELEMLQ